MNSEMDLVIIGGGTGVFAASRAAKLGLKVAFIGKLGYNDDFGKKIIDDFKEFSLDTSLISYSKEFGTGSAYIALNENGERRIYAHSGAANVLSSNDIRTEDIIKAQTIFLSNLRNLESFKKAANELHKQTLLYMDSVLKLAQMHGPKAVKGFKPILIKMAKNADKLHKTLRRK